MEKSFVMFKPETVQRGLCAEIFKRIENKGFKLIAMKFILINEEQARQHYLEHQGKDFYDELVAHISSGPVVAMVWEGNGVIAGIRAMMGTTDPMKALTGTIRGDFGATMSRNMIHGSDSTHAASREIALFFEEKELLSYSRVLENWI